MDNANEKYSLKTYSNEQFHFLLIPKEQNIPDYYVPGNYDLPVIVRRRTASN